MKATVKTYENKDTLEFINTMLAVREYFGNIKGEYNIEDVKEHYPKIQHKILKVNLLAQGIGSEQKYAARKCMKTNTFMSEIEEVELMPYAVQGLIKDVAFLIVSMENGVGKVEWEGIYKRVVKELVEAINKLQE